MASLPLLGVQESVNASRSDESADQAAKRGKGGEGKRKFPGAVGFGQGRRRRGKPEPGQPDRPSAKLGVTVESFLDPECPDHAPVVAIPEPEPLEVRARRARPPCTPRRQPAAQ